MGERIKLIPRLNTTRSKESILSEEVLNGTLVGNKVLIKTKPGRNRIKITPKPNRK
jgi:hypothetical protein